MEVRPMCSAFGNRLSARLNMGTEYHENERDEVSTFEEKRDEWIRIHGAEDLTQNLHHVFEAAENRIAGLEAENKRAWGERDHYLKKLQERNTQLQQAEAARDALYERRLPCREAEVAQARYEKAEATIDRLKVGGNCAHWYAGLLGCEMDAEQEIVCEGRDHCKVFNQVAGGPREPCWTARAEAGSGDE